MSFFANIDTTSSSFEIGAAAIPPIPENEKVLAVAEEAKNVEYEGKRSIKIKWRVSQPAQYANRVIFHNVKAYSDDKETAIKHKRMLAAIATNAGGQLFQAMSQSGEVEPSDLSLSTITNRPMVLQLGVWEGDKKPDGTIPKGNWVKAVSARKAPANAPPPPKPAMPDLGDDIPF